jgi:trimeric autotransporter adhesin
LGSGVDRDVHALAIFDEDGIGGMPPRLFAGGSFYTAGGAQAIGIARWNGANWSSTGSANFFFTYDLNVFDEDGDGPGRPALYAAGGFFPSLASGQYAYGAAKWNGQSWSALGSGTDGYPIALAHFDDDGPGPRPAALYFGGVFRNAGDKPSLFFARWGCPASGGCYANCDLSTTPPILNIADFSCFLQKFASQDPYANCDESTTPPILTVADFSCFLQQFTAGCN